MKATILFFGATAEISGEKKIEISFDEEMKAKRLFDKVLDDFPQMRRHSLLFAINQEYAKGDEIIRNGDELAVFTAVSGG